MAGRRKTYELLFTLNAALGNYPSGFQSASKATRALQNELNKLNKTSGQITSFKKLGDSIKQNERKLESATREYEQLGRKIRETQNPSEALLRQFERKGKQVKDLTEKLRGQKSGYNDLKNSLREAGVDTNNLERENQRLRDSYDEIRRAQEEVQRTQRQFADLATARSDNSAAIASAKGDLMRTVGVATSLGTALYMGPVKAAADFEAQMANVEAISGVTEEEMAKLTAKAKKMGLETKYTAVESGKALEYMAMAGWKSSQMLGGLEGIMTLAAASGEDLAMVSDIVTDSLTAFKMQAEDSAHFADVLAAASSNSNTNVALMGESFKYAAPIAGALGFSADDTAFALGLMASAGIKGTNAGTSLRSGLVNLVKPTQQMAATMDEYGISLQSNAETVEEYEAELLAAALAEKQLTDKKAKLTEAEKKVLHIRALSRGENMSLKDSLIQIRESMTGLSDAEKSAAAAAIFGKQSLSGWLAIINASDADFEKFAGSIENCAGEAQRMKDVKLDNLRGDIDLTKSAFSELSMAVGEVLTPSLRDGTKNLTDLFAKGAKYVKENPKLIKTIAKLATTFIGAKLAVQGLKLGFLQLKGGYLAAKTVAMVFRTDLTTLGAEGIRSLGGIGKAAAVAKAGLAVLSGPIGWVALGIAGITAAVLLYKNAQEKARQETIHFADDLKVAADNFQQVSNKAESTQKLIAEYKDLHQKTQDVATSAEDAAVAKERMKEIEDLLIDQNPEVLSIYDQENGKIFENLDLIERKLDKEKEIARIQLEESARKTTENLPDAIEELESAREKIKTLNEQYDCSKKLRDQMFELSQEWQAFNLRDHGEAEKQQKIAELAQQASTFISTVTGEDVALNGMADIDYYLQQYGQSLTGIIDDHKTAQSEFGTLVEQMQTYYKEQVALIELDLGGKFEEMTTRLTTMKDELKKLEENGEGGTEQAAALKQEIQELEPKVETAAGKIRDLGDQVADIPEVKTIDVEEATKGVDGLLERLKDIKPSYTTEIIVTQREIKVEESKKKSQAAQTLANALPSETAKNKLPQNSVFSKIKSNAEGNIVKKPILTTFAEDGWEAAIPIDNSARSKSLWYETGRLMGLVSDDKDIRRGSNASTSQEFYTPEQKERLDISDRALENKKSYNSDINIKINYQPTIQVDGNKDNDFENKNRRLFDDLVREIKDSIRRDNENQRRMIYL